jgi:hypothetical protein
MKPSVRVPQQFPFGWSRQKSLTFVSMWDLIMRVHGNHNPVFPPSLLMAIFWEETLFTNRKQQDGPAVGFGQLQINDWGWKLKGTDPRYASEAAILASDEISVKATSAALDHLYLTEHRSFDNCLDVYAGVSARPVNARAVAGWKTCMSAMPQPGMRTEEAVKKALQAARMVPGDQFHEEFWGIVLRGIMPGALFNAMRT